MTASKGHVFVSHSSDNRELAGELAAFLEARGVRVWIAPRDVRPGMDYSEQLQLAIEEASAFVVLVTDNANKSPYVRAETEMAFSTHKPIFPVRITDIQPAAGLALFLKIRHWTDAYGSAKKANLDRLARELQVLGGVDATGEGTTPSSTGTTPPQAPPPPPPAAAAPGPAMGFAGAGAAAPRPPQPFPAAGGPEEEKWRAAVGPKADYYLGRWRQMAEKNKAASWNWASCLANLFWFAYRKMWLPMVGVIVVFVVLGVIGAASPQAAKITLLLNIAVTFVTGTFGNHLYRMQTAKLVGQTSGQDQAAALEALRRGGGVSQPALYGSIGAVVVVTLILVAVAARNVQPTINTFGPNDQFNNFGPVDNGLQNTDDKPPPPPEDPNAPPEPPVDDSGGY